MLRQLEFFEGSKPDSQNGSYVSDAIAMQKKANQAISLIFWLPKIAFAVGIEH